MLLDIIAEIIEFFLHFVVKIMVVIYQKPQSQELIYFFNDFSLFVCELN